MLDGIRLQVVACSSNCLPGTVPQKGSAVVAGGAVNLTNPPDADGGGVMVGGLGYTR